MPLCVAQLNAGVNPFVLCTDAEGANDVDNGGFGVVVSAAPVKALRAELELAERKGAYVRLTPRSAFADGEVLNEGFFATLSGESKSSSSGAKATTVDVGVNEPDPLSTSLPPSTSLLKRRALLVGVPGEMFASELENQGWEALACSFCDFRGHRRDELWKQLCDGEFHCVHLSLPCKTWSAAARPLFRSATALLGLQGLDEELKFSVELGNVEFFTALEWLDECHGRGVLCSMECSASAFCWRTAQVKKLLKQWPWRRWSFGFCRFGSAHKRRTIVLGNYHVADLALRCQCTKPHRPLTGKVFKDGLWRSLPEVGRGYPQSLCRSLGKLLCDLWDQRCMIKRLEVERSEAMATVPTGTPMSCFPLSPEWTHCSRWKVVKAGRFKRNEHINLGELQAVLLAVKEVAKCPSTHGNRQLVFCDSQGCVGAVSKGRSSAKALSRPVRRLGSLILASGMNLGVRYIRAHENPADRPSRKRPLQ